MQIHNSVDKHLSHQLQCAYIEKCADMRTGSSAPKSLNLRIIQLTHVSFTALFKLGKTFLTLD